MGHPLQINTILLGLILLLAGVAWYSIEQEKGAQRTPLTQLQPEQINQIRIENHTGPEFTLERRSNTWMMTRPYQVPGNSSRIQRLLEIATSTSASRFQAPDNLGTFGLATPKAILHLNQTRIGVGSTHPMTQRRYLHVSDQVHLIKDRFIHHLQARAEEFISPSLLPEGSRITAINTPEWQLTFDPNGKPALAPAIPEISADDLNLKRDQWHLARASRVVPAPEDTSSSKVRIQINDRQRSISFEISQSGKHTMLIRRDLGLAYVLPKDSRLLSPPSNER